MYLAVPSFKYGWATVCTERAVQVGALRTTLATLTLLGTLGSPTTNL